MSDDRFAALETIALSDGLCVHEAVAFGARRRGLAKLDRLPEAEGLHIHKCSSVHTFGMRFALDLIWLARDGHVARVDRDVPARRLRACLRARTVIEVNAGEAARFLGALGPDGYTAQR